MSIDPYEISRPSSVLTWWLTFLGSTAVLLMAIASADAVYGRWINRQAIVSSQQYAVTNADDFYARLAAVKKIDTQLTVVDADDPLRVALREQRAFLETEMRRIVAKVPADARTPEMTVYAGWYQ